MENDMGIGEEIWRIQEYLNQIQSGGNVISFSELMDVLLQGNMKIYEISEAVGFSSQSYFWSAFIKQFGMSPSKYAKENRVAPNQSFP